MQNPVDWCAYFGAIEKDPEAITPRITVRQLMQAREHVYECDKCYEITQKVLANAPQEQFPERGIN